MGERFDLRWLLRSRCRAIARTERMADGWRIRLCTRWRWHRGECRPGEQKVAF